MVIIKKFRENDILNKNILPEKEIHVWTIRWREMNQRVLEYWDVMGENDKEKVSKYRNYEDCMRSATGKILSKVLLSQYIDVPVEKILFTKGKYGRPDMLPITGKKPVSYSISHSGELVILVFARAAAIGVDVEEIKVIPEFKEIARNFFAPEEYEQISTQKEEGLFFTYWTAKEAYVKALGLGLQKELKSFLVKNGHIFENNIQKDGWNIFPIEISKEYCASLAVFAKGENMKQGGKYRKDYTKYESLEGWEKLSLGQQQKNWAEKYQDKRVTLTEIRGYFNDIGAAVYKMPDQLEVLDAWPVTSVGKIDKKALEKMA